MSKQSFESLHHWCKDDTSEVEFTQTPCSWQRVYRLCIFALNKPIFFSSFLLSVLYCWFPSESWEGQAGSRAQEMRGGGVVRGSQCRTAIQTKLPISKNFPVMKKAAAESWREVLKLQRFSLIEKLTNNYEKGQTVVTCFVCVRACETVCVFI